MNLAYRDIRHNLFRFVFTCVGLSLLFGVVQSMVGIYRGLVFDALVVARAPQADVWVVQAATLGPFAESSRIPGDTREAIARLHGVRSAGSLTFQSVEAQHAGQKLRLYVIGFERGRAGEPHEIVAGRPITRSHFELVADRRANLALEERIRLGRNVFTVVGLTADQTASSGDPVAYMTLLDAQELQFELEPPAARNQAARGAPLAQSDTVNAVVAQLLPNVTVEGVVEAARRWKHLSALTENDQEALLTHSLVDRARRQIGLFTVTLLTVSGVVTALIIYTMTMDKLRPIATLKLIGAPDRTIIGLIIQQALAMGLTGLAMGRGLAGMMVSYFPRRVTLLPEDGLVLALIVVFICLLGSGLAVRLALKVDPATALGS